MTVPVQSPLTATQLIDEYFVETRNRIMEIAAFLDRLERADPGHRARDFRVQALTEALANLASPSSSHVEEIAMMLSDPTTEPLPALDQKSAKGAYDRGAKGVRS
jgi:hypothetical protein